MQKDKPSRTAYKVALNVVTLGAKPGMDRFLPPGVNFFEIDHPATARFKALGIEAMGQRDNLFLIAEDLGERKLEDVLKANALWDQGARTVIVAEGLVMYLPPEAVRDLFCQCAVVAGVGSRIAFSCNTLVASAAPNLRLLADLLASPQGNAARRRGVRGNGLRRRVSSMSTQEVR